MDNERTVYLRNDAQQPRLFCLYQGKCRDFPLFGRQTIGRAVKSAAPDISLASPVVSRNHGEFLTDIYGTRYCDMGSSNGTMVNGAYVTPGVPVSIREGDIIRIHGREDEAQELEVILVYSAGYHPGAHWKKLPLNSDIREVVVGRGQGLSLQDQSVSRRHASFFYAANGWAVIDHGSLNGVALNNQRLMQPAYLTRLDVVQIAGYLFFFLGDALLYQADSSGGGMSDAGLEVWIEERNVWQRAKKKTLLKDIRVNIPTGSMVLILGGSGAGKTTFMNAVMGYEKAQGKIMYRNTDIYAEYEKMKYEIGYVPQQDLLRLNDTVYNTLLNSAKMRLPAHFTAAQYAERVEKTLNLLGLERVRDSLVGKLSGGQRKRLSIAVEYIGDPSLFFLDEPDSGLDGTMARALMENLKEIADDNRIVMVISHSPDRAKELFDLVIVLAKGNADNSGHLVFFGPPGDAMRFFGVDSLEKIVKQINPPDEGGKGLADHFIAKFGREGASS